MLKSFYKFLLVSLLSGSLLMLDFSYKGLQISPLQAETLKTEKVQDGDLASTLTMTAVGLVASRLFMCKPTPDMMIAAAAGVAFLAGEVTSYSMEEKALKDQETQIYREKNGQPTQLQITLLQRLKESYQDALKTANTKKSFQKAAQMAFLMAAVMATYSAITETSLNIACRGAIATAAGTCAALFAACSGVVTCVCPTCGAGAGLLGTATAERSAEFIGASIIKPSIAAETEDKTETAAALSTEAAAAVSCPASAALVTPTCKSYDAYKITSRGVCYNPLGMNEQTLEKTLYAGLNFTPKNPEQYKQNFLESLFMSVANADLLSPMGIASSAAISFTMMTSATLGIQVDTFLFNPRNRAIIWGVLAGLTTMATSATDKQIGTINENIKKIDKILNEMNSMQNGVGTSNVAGTKNPKIEKELVKNQNIADAKLNEIDLKANGGGKLPCITSDRSDKCPSFDEKLNQSGISLQDFPQSMQANISNIGKMSDGLSGQSKISSATLDSVSTLAGQTKAIKGDLEKRTKELEEALKKVGVKADLAKDSKELTAKLNGITIKELEKRKTTAAEMLANFSRSKSGFGNGSEVATDANKDAKKDSKKGGLAVVAIPAATNPKLDFDKEMNAKLLEDKKAADEAALAAAAGGDKATTMDDYDLKNDITQDKGASIFEVISNRYQKSGYPRLFKRIK